MGIITIPALIAAGIAAYGGTSLGLGAWERGQERGIKREQLRSEVELAKSKLSATKRMTKEAKTRERRYIGELMKERTKVRQSEQEAEMMRMFSESQNQRLMLLLQAMQGLNQSPVSGAPGAGMVGTLRSNF